MVVDASDSALVGSSVSKQPLNDVPHASDIARSNSDHHSHHGNSNSSHGGQERLAMATPERSITPVNNIQEISPLQAAPEPSGSKHAHFDQDQKVTTSKPVMPQVKRVISFDDQTSRLSRSKLIIVFLGLSFTIFLALADQVTVATAEPVIGEALEAGQSIAWVGTSYLIANTSCQLIYGRMSDIFGRKHCLVFAICLLVTGNLICGFARSPAMLYIFRSIAGIGGGGMTNLAMVIVSDVVSLEQRGKWQGFLSVGAAAGSAAGPFIGAALSQHVSWRWTFWIMCPCGAACLGVIMFCLPLTPVTGSAKEKLKKVDYSGAILSLAANIFVLIPISSGGSTFAWSSPTVIALLVIGIMLFIAFIVAEWKYAPLPVMPLRLWTYRTTAITLVSTFGIGMVYFGNLFFLPIYFQVLRGMTPMKSAAFLLSLLVVQVASSLCAGILTAYTKKVMPQIRVGFAIWTIGSGLQTLFDQHTSHAKLVGILFFQGLGVGCTLQTTLVAAQAAAPNKDRACVTGLRNGLRFMGGAFGLAICNAILNNVVKSRLPPGIPDETRRLITHQISPNLPSGLSPETVAGIYYAYYQALHYIFISFVPVVGIAFILSLFSKETPLNRDVSKEPHIESRDTAATLQADEEKGANDSG